MSKIIRRGLVIILIAIIVFFGIRIAGDNEPGSWEDKIQKTIQKVLPSSEKTTDTNDMIDYSPTSTGADLYTVDGKIYEYPQIIEIPDVRQSDQISGAPVIAKNGMVVYDPYLFLYNSFDAVSQLTDKEKGQINTYVKEFGETNRYSPGTIHIKFQDNPDVQYLEDYFANKITFDERYQRQQNNSQKNSGIEGEAMQIIADELKELDKKYKLLSITRPRIRFHNPENVYLNNYYYLTFEKWYTDDNWENDSLFEAIEEWPQTEYISKDPVMKDIQITDPNYSNDPRKSDMWHFSSQYTKTYEARSAIDYYNQGNIKVGLVESVAGHEDLPNSGGGSAAHGTHTAGSINAYTNNGIGVPAISNNNLSLVINPAAINNRSQRSKIDSVASQTKVVSISQLGGFRLRNSSVGQDFRDLFAAHSDVVFLVAAGNENKNPDTQDAIPGGQYCCGNIAGAQAGTRGIFPGELARESRNLPHFMSIAASGPGDVRAATNKKFSCYGNGWITVTAPGEAIMSTVPGGYDGYNGTSMAAPTAASLAGLLRALPKGQGLSAVEIVDVITSTADPLSREGGAGRINVCAAVAAIGYPCEDYATPVKPEPSCTDGINEEDNEESGQTGNTVPAPECDDPTCAPPNITLEPFSMCSTGVITPITLSIDIPDGDSGDFKGIKYERTTSPDVGSSTSSSFVINPPITEDITVSVTVKHCFDSVSTCADFCSKTTSTTINTFDPDAHSEGEDPSDQAENHCTDGIDNDCDGLIDCQEDTCEDAGYCGECIEYRTEVTCEDKTTPYAPNPGDELCSDRQDNDGDGQVDCRDGGCAGFPQCAGTECNCCDNFDNDGDGKTDFDDPDCCLRREQTTGICSGGSNDGEKCDSNSGCPGGTCDKSGGGANPPTGGFTMVDISEPRCGPCRTSAQALNSNIPFQDMINNTDCDIEIQTNNQSQNGGGNGQGDRFDAFAGFVADHSIYPRTKEPMQSGIPHARIENSNGDVILGPTSPSAAEDYLMQNCQ